ncbi:Phosphoenolpyruvate guanylyltransferase OS=Streptomyces microflavus OX=1919 GN=cofC PE=3 SV=1 [Streptomyces microflavus]
MVVVTDDAAAGAALSALGARVVPDVPAAGLNAALAYGARSVRALSPAVPVAALNADLPALRAGELARVLDFASAFPRAFLRGRGGNRNDICPAAGDGIAPAFGGRSAARHLASGAVEITLPGVDSVRRDVDTGEDLKVALALGVGPHTERLALALPLTRDR